MADNKLIPIKELGSLTQKTLTRDIVISQDFNEQYANLLNYIKQLEDLKTLVDNQMKPILEQEYIKTGNASIESTGCRITYVPESTRETFDSKKFKEQQPELYKQFIKVSPTSASLRVKIKGNEEK